MRHDMHKVLTERPRVGGSRGCEKYGRTRERGTRGDFELLPSSEGMRPRRRGVWRKEFSDLVSPLHRFLLSRVGRPWDDVFSEVCSMHGLGSTVHWHLRRHVAFEVETEVEVREDGQVYRTVSPYQLGSIFIRGNLLYVCPRTGLLQSTRNIWL